MYVLCVGYGIDQPPALNGGPQEMRILGNERQQPVFPGNGVVLS